MCWEKVINGAIIMSVLLLSKRNDTHLKFGSLPDQFGQLITSVECDLAGAARFRRHVAFLLSDTRDLLGGN